MRDGTSREPRDATIGDVARLAGVGKSTVGRALSGRGYVSAALRERILDAARQVGYVPNLAARQLKASDSGIVGVLLPDLRNTFFAEVASGIEEVIASSDYYMVLATGRHRSEREAVAVRTLSSMKAGGVILTPSQNRGSVAQYLAARDVAVVEIDDRTVEVPRSASVMVDGCVGVRAAVEHLIDHGHRRIGAVLWGTDQLTGKDRQAGYVKALRAAKIPLDKGIMHTVPDGTEVAKRVATQLVTDREVTAIVATNELACLGVMEAIWEAGVRVPDDISIVGFDDVPWMRTTTPPMTTVAQPTVEIGMFAARAMIAMLEGRAPDKPVTRLTPTLVNRGSVGKPGRRRPARRDGAGSQT